MLGRKAKEGESACRSCRVDLLEENEDIAAVYMVTRRQVIMGPAGPVDIDIQAVKTAMDLYGIKDQRGCMEAVRHTFYHFMDKGQG